MNDDKIGRKYIAYEYKEIHANTEKISFLVDCYECFGWETDQNMTGMEHSGYENWNVQQFHNAGIYPQGRNAVARMKRNRKIINKMELTRLQRNFEACLREIESLEKSKTSAAAMSALIIGFIGTAFMAGSVFAVTAQPPQILACILLAIPAFIGWALPIFVYRRLVQKQTEKVVPYIEAKYDEIYEICEKGNKLLGI